MVVTNQVEVKSINRGPVFLFQQAPFRYQFPRSVISSYPPSSISIGIALICFSVKRDLTISHGYLACSLVCTSFSEVPLDISG
jgi:hypothetical protein